MANGLVISLVSHFSWLSLRSISLKILTTANCHWYIQKLSALVNRLWWFSGLLRTCCVIFLTLKFDQVSFLYIT